MTSSVRSLGRLFWRPASVLLVFPVFLALAWPMVRDLDSNPPDVSSPAGLATLLWAESVVLMALIGATVGGISHEAHQPLFAFAVPKLRAKLLQGQLIIGLTVALVLAAGIVYAEDGVHAVNIFACAMLFYALGTTVSDPITPRLVSLLILVACLAFASESDRIRDLFETMPAVATIGATLITGALLRRGWSIESARKRAVTGARIPGIMRWGKFTLADFEGQDSTARSWRVSLVSGRLADWVRATDYENFGASGGGWLKTLSVTVLYYGGAAYVLGNPSFAAVMGMMALTMSGHRLVGSGVYPISRSARANLLFVCSIVDSVAYFLLVSILTLALANSGLPRFMTPDGIPERPLAMMMMYFPLAFIWAPVAQWAFVTRPVARRIKTSFGLRDFAHMIAAVTFVFATYELVRWANRAYSAPVVAAGIVLAAAVVYALYWFALRWHFSRRNLV